MTDDQALPDPPRGRRRLWVAGGGLGLLVLLALLAIPLLGIKGAAEAARDDLAHAETALQDGRPDVARDHVTRARTHVDEARADAEGFGADVWRLVPVAGGAIGDVRHLVAALDDATAVAEIGLEVHPVVTGERSPLVERGQVDMATLGTVLAAVDEAGGHLLDARASLDAVDGATPFLGDAVARARDAAMDQVDPLADSYERLQPLLASLPDALGTNGPRTYLVAMLNPAELRYSGGAPLAVSTFDLDQGRIELDTQDDAPHPTTFAKWKKVRGNPFHRPGRQRFASATFAPSWPVAGEELLRAWEKLTGQRADGVIAVDVVALADLFTITGPAVVGDYGRLTGENLVEKLSGSYDDYTPEEQEALDESNSELTTAFRDRFFRGGEFTEKAKSLAASAEGRHFAMYSRDPGLQSGFAAVGLDGSLVDPARGPVGVFTQAVNPGKVDYWQRRMVGHHVTLTAEGSATARLDVRIHNDTPPYARTEPDPREGYYTRWAQLAVAAFLPGGADLTGAKVQGERVHPYLGDYYGRPFFYRTMVLEPGAIGRMRASYQVSDAAAVSEDGTLTYPITLEPQGMVNPETVSVTVTLPEGYTVTTLPEGWSQAENGDLVFSTEGLDSTPSWEIVAEPTG